MFGIGPIDAFNGDREGAVLGPSYPALGLQVLEMELKMISRAARQAFYFRVPDARIVHGLAAFT